jgi:hypothetical protein
MERINESVPKKKRRNIVRKKEEPIAHNPNEAMLQVIQVYIFFYLYTNHNPTFKERNLSNKINYDILKQIEKNPEEECEFKKPQIAL